MIKTANMVGSISRNAGGLFESVRGLVQSLAATGMDVQVLGLEDDFTQSDIAAWTPVKVRTFSPVWPRAFGYSAGYLRELGAFAPELTHTHGLWMYPSVAATRYGRRTKTPYMISAHGMLDRWAVRNSRWKKVVAHFLYEQAHMKGAACLRALCDSEARAMRQLGLKNPIAIIPNGIDLREHGNKLRAVQSPLHVGWIPDCCWHKVLLYLGRIHPKKGLVPVLRAWKEAHKSKDWIFAIAGWDQGGHEAELKHLCTELLIPWRDVRDSGPNSVSAEWPLAEVVFLGPRFGDAKAACYRSCDAFILPSLSEGLPMAVLEAWAYSKPVLMTPQCNLPAGFAADAAIRIEANPQSIAFGLSCLFNSRSSSLLAMGQRGRNLASSRFAWGHIAKEMKEVYEWMLGGGDKPASVFEG